MKNLGAYTLVWKESRYLELVIQQMAILPGKSIILWQDLPLYWLGEGAPPSGHSDPRMRELMDMARTRGIDVIPIKQAPRVEPYGGYIELMKEGSKRLGDAGYETVMILDSDWIFDLNEFYDLCADIQHDNDPAYYNVNLKNYWRTFHYTMAVGTVTLAFPPSMVGYHDAVKRLGPTRNLPYTCFHPSYVWTNREMYDKVNSWGHASYFKDRGFYEKEWLVGNDSLVKPMPAEPPPPAIMERLRRAGALIDA
jgi:hypothetical protein